MKIGVIGLGLIGGSIFKGLSQKYEVVGVSRSVKEKNVSEDYSILKDCNLVFVCSPMNATLDILDKLEAILNPNTIVTDVSSLKSFVSKKKYSYKFIPSHPMAGTEHSGWTNSFAELFNGAKWVITPLESEYSSDIETLETIIEHLGAKVIITTPEEHDKAVGLISNLPLIVAQALCKNIKDNKLAQILAASGFKDTTRLALSNLEMAEDMVTMNRENLLASIDLLKQSIDSLMDNDYKPLAEEIKKFREYLYS